VKTFGAHRKKVSSSHRIRLSATRGRQVRSAIHRRDNSSGIPHTIARMRARLCESPRMPSARIIHSPEMTIAIHPSPSMGNYWGTPASHRITAHRERVGEIDVSLWNSLVTIRTRALARSRRSAGTHRVERQLRYRSKISRSKFREAIPR
jgi:hypothetical protein